MRKWLTVVAMAIVALQALAACGPERSTMPKVEPAKVTATSVPQEADEKTFWVEYRVKSNVAGVKAEVTYETPEGDTMGGTVTLPWVKKYQFKEHDIVQLMAKNLGSGCITVQIWSLNTIAEEKEVCGLYKTAIVTGVLY